MSPGETQRNWNFRRISAVKQCKPLRSSHLIFFFFVEFSRVSPGDQSLAKEPEDSGYEIEWRAQ